MNAPVADFLVSPQRALMLPAEAKPVALGQPVPVTVAYGDGVGPEIMEATLAILKAAGARLALEPVELGAKVFERGHTAGIDPAAWASPARYCRTAPIMPPPRTFTSRGVMVSLW